mmetsp:Transcript_19546/g.62682  ORF Transcript_19546/g.62682 Transcript_19546/m.62682 type:complete len:223 (-) Transcript_19546:220-888(-)
MSGLQSTISHPFARRQKYPQKDTSEVINMYVIVRDIRILGAYGMLAPALALAYERTYLRMSTRAESATHVTSSWQMSPEQRKNDGKNRTSCKGKNKEVARDPRRRDRFAKNLVQPLAKGLEAEPASRTRSPIRTHGLGSSWILNECRKRRSKRVRRLIDQEAGLGIINGLERPAACNSYDRTACVHCFNRNDSKMLPVGSVNNAASETQQLDTLRIGEGSQE